MLQKYTKVVKCPVIISFCSHWINPEPCKHIFVSGQNSFWALTPGSSVKLTNQNTAWQKIKKNTSFPDSCCNMHQTVSEQTVGVWSETNNLVNIGGVCLFCMWVQVRTPVLQKAPQKRIKHGPPSYKEKKGMTMGQNYSRHSLFSQSIYLK